MSLATAVSAGSDFVSLAEGHSRPVLACRFANQGSCVVSGGLDAHLCIWDLEARCSWQVDEPHAKGAAVTSLDVVDNARIVTGSADRTLGVFDLETGVKQRRLVGHKRVVNQVRHLPLTQRIASVGDDGQLCLWDANSKRAIWSVTQEFPLFTVAAAAASDHLVYVSGLDPVIRCYDIRNSTSTELFSWNSAHSDSVCSLDLTSNDKLCSVGFDGTLRIHDANVASAKLSRVLSSFQLTGTGNADQYLVRSKWAHHDRYAVTQGYICDVTSGSAVNSFSDRLPTSSQVIDVDYDVESNRIAMSLTDGSLCVFTM
ncbi:LAMI_0E11188g1_1 [Lachancea mirantina]|uniref:LAMI_0E11188g1_1 n=1 Tax=Lachancea mirantina TaxID=1230905 RepID=A0A1G4JPF4_9SACH|nr:LAMI_0E11188g1_1 [Lachancea mirantina]